MDIQKQGSILIKISGIELLVQELVFATGKLSSCVGVSIEEPFGGEKAFDAYWTSSMQSASADADLGAKAKSVAISHASAGIVKDTSAIHML